MHRGTALLSGMALVVGLGLLLCECGGGNSSTDPEVGVIRVTSNTAGTDLDPDGYTASLNGASTQGINATGTAAFSDVPVGSHSVELLGLAENCSVDGSNPVAVTVSSGATAQAIFDITCTGLNSASIDVSTTTVGDDIDTNGYSVGMDGGDFRWIGPNGVTSFASIASGEHRFELSDVAFNCSVEGGNPATVMAVAGTAVPLSFQITCQGLPRGNIQVTASTANNLDPDGYTLSLNGLKVATVPVNGSIAMEGVVAGELELELTGVAPNCLLEGENPRTISLSDGASENVDYSVTCTDPPEGRIVTLRIEGWSTWMSVMNADGSGLTDLLPWDNYVNGNRRIDWSPDGSQIAFAAASGGQPTVALYVMNKDASGVTRLTSDVDSDWEYSPSWSQDGSKIAFSGFIFDSGEIWVIGSDGTGLTQLTDHPEHASVQPSWSPDGSKIAYAHWTHALWPDSDDRIYVMNADGTGVTPLTPSSPTCPSGFKKQSDSDPVWSPDGNRILFTRLSGCETWSYWSIFVMNADGTGAVELKRGTHEADWSPDGSRIVYLTDESHIFVMNADGTGQTLIREAGQGERFGGINWGG